MKEDFLHYLWRFQKLGRFALCTESAAPIRVVHPAPPRKGAPTLPMLKYGSEIPCGPVRWNFTSKLLIVIITDITWIKVMIRSSSMWCGIMMLKFVIRQGD